MNQSELEEITCSRHEARESTRQQATIGFGFPSYWLRKWREIFEPIAKRRKSKPKQLRNYFRRSIENPYINSFDTKFLSFTFLTEAVPHFKPFFTPLTRSVYRT